MAGIAKVDFDVELMIARIRQVGERSLRGGADVLREEADKIVETARSFAPVDEGRLEEAIERKMPETRDDNNRVQVEVWVNPEAPGSGGANHAMDYAMVMHEFQEPAGPIPLGPKSEAKQMAKGVVVGGKFLERAYKTRAGVIGRRLAEIMRRMIG